MSRRSTTVDLLRAAAVATLVSCGSALLADRGIPVAALGAAAAVCGALLLRPYLSQLHTAEERIAQLESESLEQRRMIYRLKKDSQDPGSRPAPRAQSGALDDGAIATAVQAIATELNETRLIESIVKNLVTTLGVTRVSLHPHDRSSDRFLRGIGAERSSGSIALIERQVTAEDETVLRLTLKRRTLLEHDSSDGDVRAAFEVASRDLSAAVPLFDRALVSSVLLVFGRPHSRTSLEVLAATASLALSATRSRSDRERSIGAASPSTSPGEARNA